jgi:hypothetical protein
VQVEEEGKTEVLDFVRSVMLSGGMETALRLKAAVLLGSHYGLWYGNGMFTGWDREAEDFFSDPWSGNGEMTEC